MKSDKYQDILEGESQYDVRFCLKCRKPTFQEIINGRWKCTEHGRLKGRRKDDKPEPASQEEIDKVNEEFRVGEFKKTLKIIKEKDDSLANKKRETKCQS